MPTGASRKLSDRLVWEDDEHLRVGDARLFLALDWEICDTFESTDEPFGFTTGEWRNITIQAAWLLATRLRESGCKTTRLKQGLRWVEEGLTR
jgi:hypothetical protein